MAFRVPRVRCSSTIRQSVITLECASGVPLVVTLNSNASDAAVQALVGHRLCTASYSTTQRTVRFVVTDGAGGTERRRHQTRQRHQCRAVQRDHHSDATTITEGDTITLTGSSSIKIPIDVPSVTIIWGDASAPQEITLPIGTTTFSLTHMYGVSVSPASPSPTKTIEAIVNVGVNAPVSPEVQIKVAAFVPTVSAGPEAFIAADTLFTGAGSFIDPGDDAWTVTINYGEGLPDHTVPYNPQHGFTFLNVYTAEGTYTITVTVTSDQGTLASTSFLCNVFTATPADPAQVTAAPGTTVDETSGNVTVELTRSSAAGDTGSLVVAELPNDAPVATGTFVFSSGSQGQGSGIQTVGKFDLRSLALGEQDTAVVTFTVFSPNGLPPQLNITNSSGALVPVQGSTVVPNSLTVTPVPGEPGYYRVRVVFDHTSSPMLKDLFGTVFTLTVPTTSPNTQSILQGEALLALNGATGAVAQPQFEVSFSRSGVSSGSETTAATVAAQASQIIPGGGEYYAANTSFIRDMLFDSYRDFGDITDAGIGAPDPNNPAANGPGETSPSPTTMVFSISKSATCRCETPGLQDASGPVKTWYAFANDDASWFAF